MNLLFTKNYLGKHLLHFGLLLILLLYIPAASAQSFNFSPSSLKGTSLANPTSLQFGPDGRLYVAQQNGIIKAFSIKRNGKSDYAVTATETISLINQIPNHNDNGALNTSVIQRQVTGILLDGTAAKPVLYVTSSDSRMGGPSGDLNLDTNSGIISRLSWTGSAWDKVDLVRGLPRSEENHATNGMQLDKQNNILYVAVGGFTNAGSPSINFAYITEYALSAAILSVDLGKINALPTLGSGNTKYKYNLPTLDDPTRANKTDGSDPNDPFGGNDGLNQAKIVAGGPVQVYSSGYRNPYDLVITKTPGKARRMYTVDNGANQGWGGYPDKEGTQGSATNKYVSGEPGSSGTGINEPQVNNLDNFHYIGNIDTYKPGSMYAGHPNPVRANPAGAGLYTRSGSTGVWRSSKTGTNPLPADWPPLPLSMAKSIEGDYQSAGEADNSLLTFTYSTNGMAEYTASNFNNALKGNLLVTSYNGEIYRIKLNDAGTAVLNSKGSKRLNQDQPFASNFGAQPLDIVAQADNDVFAGSVWVATYGANGITIFEPSDFGACGGQYSTSIDDDGDGYSNADEIDNKTDPCSASSKPADFDKDLLSDLKDTDDDDDKLPDNTDYFVLDAQNGLATRLPVMYDMFNNNPGTGFFGLGFTGLMSNKKADNNYHNQFEENNLIAGGTAGAFSIVAVSAGDALASGNNQKNAFQFGINVSSGTGPFTVKARMSGTFFNNQTPQNNQAQGIYIGTGDQDNYLKIVLNANGGSGGIQVVYESAGVATSKQYALSGGIPSATLDLYLAINPKTGTVQPKYARNGGTAISVGSPIQLKGALLSALQGAPALAVGMIATSRSASPFTATWDYINVTNDAVTATGDWATITPASGKPIGREENGYVQAGNKFYLIGGRGIKPVQVYDPATKTWVNKANTPIELHHFQAITYEGLIYVIGAFTGSYPSETPVPNIYIYNPLTDKWYKGPAIPTARRRGAAGAVLRNGKIYLAGGITNGHKSGFVNWFDEYDPATNTWKTLPNAPRTRDHFQAAIINSKLYLASGRRTSYSTGQTFSLTIPEVDVYDFVTGSWKTLPSSSNLPTKRAGASTVVLGDELVVVGGESTQPAGHREAEALDVKTNTWRKLANLDQGRHGTQAIESNNGLYIVSGAGNQGGSPLLSSQESFYLYSPTAPTAVAMSQGQLKMAASIDFGQVAVNASTSKSIVLTNTSGSQAILVSSITISGAGSFSYSAPHALPFVVPAGASINLNLKFSPAAAGAQTATLTINHSGQGGKTTGSLSGSTNGTPSVASLYQLNAGGSEVTLGGKNWAADKYFTGGKVYSNLKINAIANTTSDELYKTERSSATPFGYGFPVKNGNYSVKLHFAEIYWGATGGGSGGVGKRVFSVNLEGGTVELPDFDIYKEVGAMAALVKSFNVAITDGILNIDFTVKVDQPKISAIEIIPLADNNPTPEDGQLVTSLTLVNADNNQDLQTLTNGSTLNLATLPTKNLNIRANTNPATVGSVKFSLSGTQSKSVTESGKPYALFGDDTKGDYYAWTPVAGSYTLKAVPYTASKGTGTAGIALAVNFTVVNGISNESGSLITNIAAASGRSYKLAELTAGEKMYTDRSYQITKVPAFLQYASFIQPANDDKWSTSTSLLSFELSEKATVYVAYDPRGTTLPNWLSGWQKLTDRLGVADSKISSMNLYSKTFAAGKVTLGGNMASPAKAAETGYLTIAVPASQAFTATQTGVAALIKDEQQGISLRVFPNPNTGDKMQMEAEGFSAQETVSITIYDVLGREVQRLTVSTDVQGGLSIEVPFNKQMSRGVYFVNTYAASGQAQTKLSVR